jgi:WD40 repeat protein
MKRIVQILVLSYFLSPHLIVSQTFKAKLTEHSANVESLTFSPDGSKMASGDWNGTIQLYTLDSNKNFVLSNTLSGHLAAVTTLKFSRNGKYLVSSGKDYSVKVWNLDTISKSKTFNPHTLPITSAFLDPSSKYLITGSEDGTVKTTPINNVKKTREIKVGSPVTSVLVTKNFKYYYVAIKGGSIKKYEAYGKNNLILTFTGHTDDINDLDLSPDEKLLASGSNDKSIIVWDVLTAKTYKTLTGFEWKVTSIEFSSDGKHIVGGCNDGVAKLFEVETSKLVSDFKEIGKNVRDVALSNDGTILAVATYTDGEIFGAIIYDSGITSTPPTIKRATKPGAKPAPKARTVKPKK